MKDFLKVYKAKLHILTPTFIGSGKEISKKEYRLLMRDQKIAVYDPGNCAFTELTFGFRRMKEGFDNCYYDEDYEGYNKNRKIHSSCILRLF